LTATDSGVELKILKRLFTPEEAEVILIQKDTENRYEPPSNVFGTYINMLNER